MNLRESNFVKEKYRVLAEVDLDTLDFYKEMKEDGKRMTYVKDNEDFYIPCGVSKDSKITFVGLLENKHLLCLYTTNSIWNSHKDKIDVKQLHSVNIWESEVDVYFFGEQLDEIAGEFKARTKGASIKPYDVANLKVAIKKLKKDGAVK